MCRLAGPQPEDVARWEAEDERRGTTNWPDCQQCKLWMVRDDCYNGNAPHVLPCGGNLGSR